MVYPPRLTRRNGQTGVVPAGPWEAAAAKAFLMALLQPALVLIDHGHFQYNSVCLGLAMAGAVAAASGDRRGGEMMTCKPTAIFFSCYDITGAQIVIRTKHGG